MNTGSVNNHYTANSRALLKHLDQFLSSVDDILIEKYGAEKAASIHQEALIEYESLIPQIPDIGGKDNFLLENLTRSACLAS